MRTGLSKNPKNFSANLWDGRVVRKYLALTNACSPTTKLGTGVRFASVGPWYWSWASAMVDLSSWCSLSRSTTKSFARDEAKSCSG